MKKLTYLIIMITMIIFLVNPLSGNAGSGYSGGGHSGHSYSGGGHSGHSYSGRGYQGRGYHGSYYGGYHGRYYGGYHGYYGYHYGHYGYWYGGWWFPWVGLSLYLPVYYQTVWIGGYPYYYADGEYYAPTTDGYMVVNPQPQAVSPQTGQQTGQQAGQQTGLQTNMEPSTKLFIYPRNGQSEKQQAEDRSACDRWAVGQTGYDPTKPTEGMSSFQKNADYQRAMVACLDGRGYSTK
jgi:hypothetical protein